MAKLTLSNVANISGAESAAIGVINANSDAIETALENTLSRDGTSPNSMAADLDMGNNDILNVDNIDVNTITIDGVPIVTDEWVTLDPELLALAGLTSATDKVPYFTGSGTAALADFTSVGRALVASAAVTDIRNQLDTAVYVATRTALKALDSTKDTTAILTESGREGTFIWRAGDYSTLITADIGEGIYIKANAISSSVGAWERLRIGEEYRAEWFVDDLSVLGALNLAIARIGNIVARPSKAKIPAGFYNLDDTITLPINLSGLSGEGPYKTYLYFAPASPKTSVIDAGLVTDNLIFDGFSIDCAANAQYGVLHATCRHAKFLDFEVTGATVFAIRTDDGYTVQYERVKCYENTGGGIDHRGVNNNNITFSECVIYANDGLGVKIANGSGVVFDNCGIEGNKQGGVAAYDLKGLRFNGGYFERNGEDGYAFTTGTGSSENMTVKADILLLSGGMKVSQTTGQSCTGVSIDSVSFTPYGYLDYPSAGLSQDCHIFAPGADDLRISNCKPWNSDKSPLVGLYNNGFQAVTESIVIDGMTDANSNIILLGTGSTTFAYSSAHKILRPNQKHAANYASSNVYSWGILSGTTGTLAKVSNLVNGNFAWAIGAGDRVWGITLDLNANPELKGKLVWFGTMYQVSDTGSGLLLYNGGNTSHDGSVTETATAAGTWVTKSVIKKIGAADTSLTFAMQRIGSGSNPIYIHPPQLHVVGVDQARSLLNFPKPIYAKSAVPADGYWTVGERILNAAPAVGQPKAWVCTVAGSPGTLVSEGNL